MSYRVLYESCRIVENKISNFVIHSAVYRITNGIIFIVSRLAVVYI
jgi:hypothetical protein